jgi:hypothetical protein
MLMPACAGETGQAWSRVDRGGIVSVDEWGLTDMRRGSDRLVLRGFRVADVRDVHVYASDPEVTPYTDWGPRPGRDAGTRDRERQRRNQG